MRIYFRARHCSLCQAEVDHSVDAGILARVHVFPFIVVYPYFPLLSRTRISLSRARVPCLGYFPVWDTSPTHLPLLT